MNSLIPNTINNNYYQDIYSFRPIKKSDFIIKEPLGKGKFATVYKVQYKKNGRIYALKEIKNEYFQNTETDNERWKKMQCIIQDRLNDYFREKTILYDLTKRNYPYVVKLFADFEEDGYKYLVMELVQGEKLENLKGSYKNNGYLDEISIIDILTQLLEILRYLHDTCHIIHRDIKPDNIIMGKDKKIKLLDFGLAVYLENPNPTLVSNRSLKGPIRYVPPEVIFTYPHRQYDYKFDIFSLGFTIYSLMNPSSGKIPNLPQFTKKQEDNIERIDSYLVNTFYHDWLTEFVFLLHQNEPKKRPTAAEALGLLKQFQTNPKIKEIYINLKQQRNHPDFDKLNSLTRTNKTNVSNNNIDNNIDYDAQIINNKYGANKFNSYNSSSSFQKKITIDEFLQPNIGFEKNILTSMKSILRILYRLDITEFIKAQLDSIFSNRNLNLNELFVYKFFNMLNEVKKWETGQMNNNNYDKTIGDFIRTLIFKNNSGISGNRPIILIYMISSIFKDEFNKYFYDYPNTILDNCFSGKNYMIMNNQFILDKINQTIFRFKCQYKGPFVDNFYFIILTIIRCPSCSSINNIDSEVSHFLQLDVQYPQNKITDLIYNYFKLEKYPGNYRCSCGIIGTELRQKVFLNSPKYLFLEFEDKNMIYFSDIIEIPLLNGNKKSYQFVASIYKAKINSITNFVAVVKIRNSFIAFFEDGVKQITANPLNLDCPSLALYKELN